MDGWKQAHLAKSFVFLFFCFSRSFRMGIKGHPLIFLGFLFFLEVSHPCGASQPSPCPSPPGLVSGWWHGVGVERSFFTPISLWRVLCEWSAVVTAPLLLPSSHDLSLHLRFRHDMCNYVKKHPTRGNTSSQNTMHAQ